MKQQNFNNKIFEEQKQKINDLEDQLKNAKKNKKNGFITNLATAVVSAGISAVVTTAFNSDNSDTDNLKNNEIERLQMRIAELEKQIKERTASYEKYYNEVKSLDKLNDDLENKVAKLEKEVRRLTEENNKYSSQIYEYKNTVASLEAELKNK